MWDDDASAVFGQPVIRCPGWHGQTSEPEGVARLAVAACPSSPRPSFTRFTRAALDRATRLGERDSPTENGTRLLDIDRAARLIAMIQPLLPKEHCS